MFFEPWNFKIQRNIATCRLNMLLYCILLHNSAVVYLSYLHINVFHWVVVGDRTKISSQYLTFLRYTRNMTVLFVKLLAKEHLNKRESSVILIMSTKWSFTLILRQLPFMEKILSWIPKIVFKKGKKKTNLFFFFPPHHRL